MPYDEAILCVIEFNVWVSEERRRRETIRDVADGMTQLRSTWRVAKAVWNAHEDILGS